MNVIKYVPKGITKKVSLTALRAGKHSPSIMFGVGVVGVVGTAVLSARATMRLETVINSIEDKKFAVEQRVENVDFGQLDEKQQKQLDKAVRHDTAVITGQGALQIAKLYAPAVICGVVSIGLLTGSHVQLTKRNAGALAALASVSQAYEQYKDRVAGELGAEKAESFLYDTETVTEKQINEDGKTVNVKHSKTVGLYSPYARCYDETARDWKRSPGYNKMTVLTVQSYANDLLQQRGFLFLNDVYDLLGLSKTSAGQIVGWIAGKGDDFVSFGLDKGRPGTQEFLNGHELSVWLDFNVAGAIYNMLDELEA